MLKIFGRKSPPAPGMGQGVDGSVGSSKDGGDGQLIVRRHHIDNIENQIRYRWLLDSYEGGERYRNAVYGPDRKGLPCRNLFRHRREYPDPYMFPTAYSDFPAGLAPNNASTDIQNYGAFPGMLGADPAATAQDDDYEARRARTPVPEFVAEAVEIHLSKVYDQEVTRAGSSEVPGEDDADSNPPQLLEWWDDVDGKGTGIDDWMRETIAPLLLVLGNLPIIFDHPAPPVDAKVVTVADEQTFGLDKCIASYILPENLRWWKQCRSTGRFTECLITEYADASDRIDEVADGKNGDKKTIDPLGRGQDSADWRKNYIRFRYWNKEESILYNFNGDEILEQKKHNFGCVPILNLVDVKKHRSNIVGKSRYEAIAALQREYYNVDSELTLSSTLHAHPLLSMSKALLKADNVISIGPAYVLPIDVVEGVVIRPEFVTPSSDPADSLRKTMQCIIDMKDRRACLTKPAGVTSGAGAGGGGSSVVAQSGISKTLDANTGHKVLTSIAQSLAKAERLIAEFALLVLLNGVPDPAILAKVSIVYPAKFDLQSADEITGSLSKMNTAASSVGDLPETQSDMLKSAMRQALPGQDDEDYASKDAEIDRHVTKMAGVKQATREAGIADLSNAFGRGGGRDSGGGVDPGGQSGGTAVSGTMTTN